jgi:ADP-heptose:LPS heptosyltransferase
MNWDIFAKMSKKPFVYLIRKRALGDVLWIEPLIRQLASRNKKVIVYTKYPELFLHYPLPNVRFVNRLRFWEKAGWMVERLFRVRCFFIDLEHAYEKNPRMHLLSAYQQAAGLPMTREYPKIYLSGAELAYQPPGIAGKYVVLHLESLTDRNYRKVFGVDWDQVVSALSSKGLAVVLIGKNPDPVAGAIHVKTTIRGMIPVIRGAAIFIGIDSGPSHLAAAVGVPSLIFFGAVNPDFRHFRDLLKGRILQQYCEFAGCYHEGPPGVEPSCRLVGDKGIPKCSLHTTAYVLNNIDLLIEDFPIHD